MESRLGTLKGIAAEKIPLGGNGSISWLPNLWKKSSFCHSGVEARFPASAERSEMDKTHLPPVGLLTVKEAAAVCQVTPRKIYYWTQCRVPLRVTRFSGRLYIAPNDLKTYQAQRNSDSAFEPEHRPVTTHLETPRPAENSPGANATRPDSRTDTASSGQRTLLPRPRTFAFLMFPSFA